jgi:cell wall assembly regulator SMI1
MSLIDSLNHILEWHQKNDTPVARLLQPGLSEELILNQLKAVPFQMPREFVELYKWRNGVAWDDQQEGQDVSFFEYHRFLPLNEALDVFQSSYAIMKEFYELTDWVQVFQDPAGDGYGVSGAPRVVDQAPVVFLFEGEGVQVVFDSLAKMMETAAAAFGEGAMTWENGRLETDFFAWGEIAHRLNPGIQYWRDYVKGGKS